MAKINETYELITVFSMKLGEDGIKALVSKFNSMIEENGSVSLVDEWGKRRLAYAINYESEGYYVLWNFTCQPDFPAELDRVLQITEGVLRSLITVKQ